MFRMLFVSSTHQVLTRHLVMIKQTGAGSRLPGTNKTNLDLLTHIVFEEQTFLYLLRVIFINTFMQIGKEVVFIKALNGHALT